MVLSQPIFFGILCGFSVTKAVPLISPTGQRDFYVGESISHSLTQSLDLITLPSSSAVPTKPVALSVETQDRLSQPSEENIVDTNSGRDYIVVFRNDATSMAINSHMDWVLNTSRTYQQSITSAAPNPVKRTFKLGAFQAYCANLDSNSLAEVSNSESVDFVEEDQVWSTLAMVTEANATWGLDYISNSNPQMNATAYTYTYDKSSGSDTYAYVVDSGVEIEHEQFEGRAKAAYNAVSGTNHTDNAGHGTHVAGIIAGRTFGVVKKGQIMSVKVFGPDGSGSSSDVLDGFQWAVNDIITNNRTDKSIINMSLGGGYSAAFNLAVKQAYDAGVLSVVAAGNGGADVNNSSPASEPSAITVGATQKDMSRSSYSNYGVAVDVFAPGTEILSAFSSSVNATATLSGTSMAAPFVSGLVLYLKALGGLKGPEAATKRLLQLARKDMLQNVPSGTANLFVFNGLNLTDNANNDNKVEEPATQHRIGCGRNSANRNRNGYLTRIGDGGSRWDCGRTRENVRVRRDQVAFKIEPRSTFWRLRADDLDPASF